MAMRHARRGLPVCHHGQKATQELTLIWIRGEDREGTILAERFVVESESQLESNPDTRTGRMDRDQWPKDRRIRLTRSPLHIYLTRMRVGGKSRRQVGAEQRCVVVEERRWPSPLRRRARRASSGNCVVGQSSLLVGH